jgi:hypothetical protein
MPKVFTFGIFVFSWEFTKLISQRERLFFSGDTAAKALGEFVDTATGVNNFLLTGVERVAFTAHVYVEIAFAHGRSSNEFVTTAAANSYWNVIWMNFWFHDVFA